MTVLRIEHKVSSFEAWKGAFDRDPVGREAGGVRRYRISRSVDDPDFVAVDLEFDDHASAHTFQLELERMWRSAEATSVLGGTPQTSTLQVVEERTV